MPYSNFHNERLDEISLDLDPTDLDYIPYVEEMYVIGFHENSYTLVPLWKNVHDGSFDTFTYFIKPWTCHWLFSCFELSVSPSTKKDLSYLCCHLVNVNSENPYSIQGYVI